MDYIGYPSAVAMGYIHGNTKGAIEAAKLYQTFSNRDMAPITRGRDRAPVTPNRSRHRTGHLPSRSRSTKRFRARSNVSMRSASSRSVRISSSIAGSRSATGSSTAGSSVRLPRITKRERQPRVKRKKNVKVSTNFRAKTNVVIAEKKVKGIFVTDQVEFMRIGEFANTQNWAAFPNNDGADPSHGQLFGFTRVVHAASRMWNDKRAQQIPIINQAQTYGSETDNSSLSNYKIDVQKQWWEFSIKNNTHQTLDVKIHQCGHKKNGNYDDPLDILNEGLIFDFNEGNTISAIGSGNPNAALNSFTTLVKPELVTPFKNNYSTKSICAILEPGQEYSFTVQGPSMIYEGKKFFSQTAVGQALPIYNTKQKNDISLLWQVTTDMGGGWSTTGDTSGYGILPTPFVTAEDRSHGLIIRSRYHAKLLMPEQVGFNHTIAAPTGTVQTMELRKDVICMDDFKDRLAANFVNTSRLDPLDPQGESDL